MNANQLNAADQGVISSVIQRYIDGARSSGYETMAAAFHEQATIFGYLGDDLIAGPISVLFDWRQGNGPAMGLRAKIERIDVAGSVATVRLELDNWTGHRFTDLFTLLRVDGEWKIMHKVFHLHKIQ